jgi:two-component system cell cycle response regulator
MGARILIIEDNPANLELMVYMLKAAGHRVTTAMDGASGLAAAREQKPDLILCDLQLPVLDGYEVAARLMQDPVCRDIPRLAVTAFAMAGDRDRTLGMGFDGYLAKPIEPETFVLQVEAFLAPEHRTAGGKVTAHAQTMVPAGPKRARHRILVVDNHPVNLELAVSLLEASGYEVVTAQNGEDGLALARRRRPALIISDVCMGKQSGYDFLERVKQDPGLSEIPFVFLTSTAASTREQAHGMSLGARRYLIRPLEPERMLAEVAACIPSGA